MVFAWCEFPRLLCLRCCLLSFPSCLWRFESFCCTSLSALPWSPGHWHSSLELPSVFENHCLLNGHWNPCCRDPLWAVPWRIKPWEQCHPSHLSYICHQLHCFPLAMPLGCPCGPQQCPHELSADHLLAPTNSMLGAEGSFNRPRFNGERLRCGQNCAQHALDCDDVFLKNDEWWTLLLR